MSVTKIKTVTKGDQSSTNHQIADGITCNGCNNLKTFTVPCCGNCHRTKRNRYCTSWYRVEEILCVSELILISMGCYMWLTRNYDSCSPQGPRYHRPEGSAGGPLWQGAPKLSRAAAEKGRPQCGNWERETTGNPVLPEDSGGVHTAHCGFLGLNQNHLDIWSVCLFVCVGCHIANPNNCVHVCT